MKIKLDKYYTDINLAKFCIDKTFEIIGKDNITEIIEPSAGNGSFSSQIENCIAYDIEPDDNSIIKQDFLKLDLLYKKGRLIIGNPPFGVKNTLSVQFFKKSIKLCDYIAFILPISQLNNNKQMFDFDLIYSEDIGNYKYSNVELNCCFNIYQRPKNSLNKKENIEINGIKLIEYRRGTKENIPLNFDYSIGVFGAGCVGRVPEYIGKYVTEIYFYINHPLKSKILETIKTINWKDLSKGISGTYRLPQWKIKQELLKQIPELDNNYNLFEF